MHTQAHWKVEALNYRRLQESLKTEFPALDDETLADTLEGITSLPDMIAEVVRSALGDQAMAASLKIRLNDMRKRLTRIEERVRRKRELALDAMVSAEIKKLIQPDFTLSVRLGAPALVVTSEDEIPPVFWITQPAKLDRQGLLTALKSGEVVPGAALSNPSPSISVRTK